MKIIVAVTGASGTIMSYRLLKAMRSIDSIEVHLIVSEGARLGWELENRMPAKDLYALADVIYDEHDMAAAISSGSFVTDGMIIMPCSMKTLAGIVSGYAENLILRAADVCMKEGRKIVLIPRETPLSRLHLRNLKEAADLGCMIVPPMLTFYNEPKTIEDEIDHIVGKVLMQFGLETDGFRAWKGRSGD